MYHVHCLCFSLIVSSFLSLSLSPSMYYWVLFLFCCSLREKQYNNDTKTIISTTQHKKRQPNIKQYNTIQFTLQYTIQNRYTVKWTLFNVLNVLYIVQLKSLIYIPIRITQEQRKQGKTERKRDGKYKTQNRKPMTKSNNPFFYKTMAFFLF